MDAEELREALTQVVQNYRRCGLALLPRLPDGLPSDLEQGLEALFRPEASPTAAQSPVQNSTVSPPADPSAPPTATSLRAATVPANQPTPASNPSPGAPQLKEWTLPVLPAEQRESRFAELSQQAAACRKCEQIVQFRQQSVFGSGCLTPDVCFVGEAPGADEDRQGVPFVGKAGQLLTKIIAAMHLSREEVYILNALKCRPPQNRTPVPEEIDHCRGFVEAQLETLKPKYIVCLGAVAVRSVLQSQAPVGRLRGRFHHYRGAQVVVTYHPSYLLRNADAKRLVWDDMKMLMAAMGLSPS